MNLTTDGVRKFTESLMNIYQQVRVLNVHNGNFYRFHHIICCQFYNQKKYIEILDDYSTAPQKEGIPPDILNKIVEDIKQAATAK